MKMKPIRLTLIIMTDDDAALIAYLSRLSIDAIERHLRAENLIQDDEYLAQKWANPVHDLPPDVVVLGEENR